MALDPQAPNDSTAIEGTPEHTSMVRKAALASTVGTTIEWYDFFLYNTAAALIFPAVFFPASSTLRRPAGVVRDLCRRLRRPPRRRVHLRPLG